MAGFFDFIKKPTSNANPVSSPQVQPMAPPPVSPVQPVQIVSPQPEPVQQPTQFSGIGSGPSGNSFSGIGTPPTPTPVVQHEVGSPVVPTSHSVAHAAPPVHPVVPASDLTSHINDQKRSELDIMTHLTQRSNRVFLAANTKAKELQNIYVDSEHLLHGLVTDGEIYKLFIDLKIQPQVIEQELAQVYKKENSKETPQTSPRVKRIIDNSLVIARKLGFEFISPEHILLALYEEGEGVGARILVKLGLKKEDLNKKILGKKEGLEGQKGEEKKKSVLDQYTIDLTAKATQGLLDPVVERSEVIERVIHILSRRTKNNPALVGEAGVGKTAIVEGLAQKIVQKQVPEPLLDKRILQLDLMNVIAGSSHRGDFEERMKNLIEEIKASQGKIIMFIDEIHTIVGAGASGEGALDASNFLKPALARGEMQLIGATTLTEYRKYIEKDPALERRFQPVLVPEPTEEQAIKMLEAIKDKYEAFHKVKIPQDVIEASVKLSKRYVGDRFLPDKAVDLIDEAASAVRLPLLSLPEEIKSLESRISQLTQEHQEAEKSGDQVKARILKSKVDDIQGQLKEKQDEFNVKKGQSTAAVSIDVVKDIVARWTGIPVSKISGSETEKLANLEKIMHERLIDQNAAVTSVAQAVRRGRAGLKSAVRPIGSFVFLGPTGVGKTELAKTLADILFGTEDAMVRFDMTEYMEKHEVAKLLGAPPGYVGYEEGGKLTEAVRRRPYSVVLFDEVEKAHPDIFNILLQILDDGRLTDNKGHVVSFKNTVVICTSNIGTKIIQDELMKYWEKEVEGAKNGTNPTPATTTPEVPSAPRYDQIKAKVMDELGKFFKPELINRFDEVIVFEPLKLADMMQIVKLQLKGVVKLLEDQDMGFTYTDAAIKEIVRAGFDPIYGARPLRRAIQKLIENPISSMIIEGKVKLGDAILADFDGTNFVFKIQKVQLTSSATVEGMKHHFVCNMCGNTFDTEVTDHSSVVCTKCASTSVKEVQAGSSITDTTDHPSPTPEPSMPPAPTIPEAPTPPVAPMPDPASQGLQPQLGHSM